MPGECTSVWPGGLEHFQAWYAAAGLLKIFWAKPLARIQAALQGPEVCRLEIVWTVRRKPRPARLWLVQDPAVLTPPAPEDPPTLALFPEDAHNRLAVAVQARSMVYLWPARAPAPPGNSRVRVRVLDTWNEADLAALRQVQRASWGFWIPPVAGTHRVLLAVLESEPVGLAYWNPKNGNLDFGIHVARPFWRQRIGTRLFSEALGLTRKAGLPYLTVVRVFRSLRQAPGTPPLWGTAADRRALAFYRFLGPKVRRLVVRLRPPQGSSRSSASG